MAKHSQHSHQEKLVVEKTCTWETNDQGQEIVRTVRVFDDGSRIVEETPIKEVPSDIPVVQATCDPDTEQPSYANVSPPFRMTSTNGSPTVALPYAAPPTPVQPTTTTTTQIITVGGPQIMQMPYIKDDYCGCRSHCGPHAWGCCCFWTILVFLVLGVIGSLLPEDDTQEEDNDGSRFLLAASAIVRFGSDPAVVSEAVLFNQHRS